LPDGRPLFIVNPVAGGGRPLRLLPKLRAFVRQRGVAAEFACTERPGHAVDLAKHAAEQGFAPVVGVGGDGTLHEIANGLLAASNSAPLAVVPSGAGNDFARCLGLLGSPDVALDVVWNGVEQVVDVAACNGRYFLNVGGVGFDARVARTATRVRRPLRIGFVPYLVGILTELVRNTSDELVLHLDDRTMRRTCFMVAVANGRFYGGGMKICPGASRTDGLLDLCVVGDATRFEVLRLLPKVFSGGHAGHPKVEMLRARRVRLEGRSEVEVEVDGELVGLLPAQFEVMPSALRVLVAAASRTSSATIS
jgi:diacylglycerol kinase (ATP)